MQKLSKNKKQVNNIKEFTNDELASLVDHYLAIYDRGAHALLDRGNTQRYQARTWMGAALEVFDVFKKGDEGSEES